MTVSCILTPSNQEFVMEQVTKQKTKTAVINEALDFHRKYLLKKDLMEGFAEQTDEDVAEAMANFGDYLKIIDDEEND